MTENNLNIIISILEIVFFVTLTVLAIYLMTYIKKFLSSVSKIENEVTEISGQLSPVISDIKFITEDIKVIVDKSKKQFDKIEDVSESLVGKGVSLLNTINKVQNVSTGFLFNTRNLMNALTKGVKTFGNKLRNGSEPKQLKSSD